MENENSSLNRNCECVINCDNTNNTHNTDRYGSTAKLPSTNHKLLKIMVIFLTITTIGLVSFVIYKETNSSEKPTEVSHTEPQSQAMKGVVNPPTQKNPPKGIIYLYSLETECVGLDQSARTEQADLVDTLGRCHCHCDYFPPGGLSYYNSEIAALSHIETYRLDSKGKEWAAASRHPRTFSEPVQNKLCIRITDAGEYEVYNKITLQYEERKSVYHGLLHKPVAHQRKDYLVEKNNFQWGTPQTGRTPSALMSLGSIDADVGDLLCVQTGQTTDIYVSWADNHFLLKKVG